MKFAVFFLVLFVLISCGSGGNKKPNKASKIQSNLLDSVLGEKILDAKAGEVRPDNFNAFLSLSSSNLADSSELYTVRSLGKNYKILSQKKSYLEARCFDVILKVDHQKVANYLVIQDYKVMDAIQDSSGIYLLLGDLENYNSFWKAKNAIRLLFLDVSLNVLCEYSADSKDYPLEASSLEMRDGNLFAKINVITGCQLCTSTFELSIDSFGNCIHMKKVGSTAGAIELADSTISKIFMN